MGMFMELLVMGCGARKARATPTFPTVLALHLPPSHTHQTCVQYKGDQTTVIILK